MTKVQGHDRHQAARLRSIWGMGNNVAHDGSFVQDLTLSQGAHFDPYANFAFRTLAVPSPTERSSSILF